MRVAKLSLRAVWLTPATTITQNSIQQLTGSPLFLTLLSDKDVARTDRDHPYFAGEGNEHLQQLREILLCYVAHDPELGVGKCVCVCVG